MIDVIDDVYDPLLFSLSLNDKKKKINEKKSLKYLKDPLFPPLLLSFFLYEVEEGCSILTKSRLYR